jgi:hypothetical protein
VPIEIHELDTALAVCELPNLIRILEALPSELCHFVRPGRQMQYWVTLLARALARSQRW